MISIESLVHLAFVRIPAGEFLMGSDKVKDSEAYDDELPQLIVALDEFFIGKYPITIAQFAVFAQTTHYKTLAERQGSAHSWNSKDKKWVDTEGANWQHPQGPESAVALKQDHPVSCVSWDDALAFCSWLTQASGRDIRLPTEAQWEKAARGTNGNLYPWGNQPPDDARCNFNMNVGDTTKIGTYSPDGDSPYGCADMAGNVWEWCADWLDEQEYERRAGKGDSVRNPLGPQSGTRRIVRGGDFADPQRDVRCAARGRLSPDYHGIRVGFRVCSFLNGNVRRTSEVRRT